MQAVRSLLEKNVSMAMGERIWRITQKHLGYTDEEAQDFKQDPWNADVLSKSTGMMGKLTVPVW